MPRITWKLVKPTENFWEDETQGFFGDIHVYTIMRPVIEHDYTVYTLKDIKTGYLVAIAPWPSDEVKENQEISFLQDAAETDFEWQLRNNTY